MQDFQREAERAWSVEKSAQITQEAEILGSTLSNTHNSNRSQKDVRLFMLLANLIEDRAKLQESIDEAGRW